jgi:hypothetical protein
VRHRIFHPSPAEPLDFEGAIELTIKDWMRCFAIRQILFDPWQMQATAQRLQRIGVPIKEFPQTVPNLTSIGQNLFDLIKGGNLAVYHSDQIRQAVLYAVAKETPRGWRIAKEKASHKIDAVIALAMACHAAVKRGYVEETAMATPIVTCGTEELSGPAANVRGVRAGGICARWSRQARDCASLWGDFAMTAIHPRLENIFQAYLGDGRPLIRERSSAVTTHTSHADMIRALLDLGDAQKIKRALIASDTGRTLRGSFRGMPLDELVALSRSGCSHKGGARAHRHHQHRKGRHHHDAGRTSEESRSSCSDLQAFRAGALVQDARR